MDIFIVSNSLLGFFAAVSCTRDAWQAKSAWDRLVRWARAAVAFYIGAIYAGVLLDAVSVTLLGPVLLRPLLSIILLVMIGASWGNSRHVEDADKRFAQMEDELAQAQAEISKLHAQVDWLMAELMQNTGRQMSDGAPSKRVLLAMWPDSGGPMLDTAAELAALRRSGIRLHTVPNPVTREKVLNEWEESNPAIVHIGGHGDESGVMLSDGLADVPFWAGLARLYNTGLVVIVGCQSLAIVDAMHDAGVRAVIGMRHDVPDDVAVQFVSMFYRHLLSGKSASNSVHLARLVIGDSGDGIVLRGNYEWEPRQ